ncbi:hypothetical protein [Virgibacillus kimchii]
MFPWERGWDLTLNYRRKSEQIIVIEDQMPLREYTSLSPGRVAPCGVSSMPFILLDK